MFNGARFTPTTSIRGGHGLPQVSVVRGGPVKSSVRVSGGPRPEIQRVLGQAYATRPSARGKAAPAAGTTAASATETASFEVPTKCWGQRLRNFKENCKWAQGFRQNCHTWVRNPLHHFFQGLKGEKWEEYPMTEIRTHYQAVMGPAAPDVSTNFPLLQGYLEKYKEHHRGAAENFVLGIFMSIFLPGTHGVFYMIESGTVLLPLMVLMAIMGPLWQRFRYHSARHRQITLKLVTVENVLKNAATATATATSTTATSTTTTKKA